jgi:hypothetical protein
VEDRAERDPDLVARGAGPDRPGHAGRVR